MPPSLQNPSPVVSAIEQFSGRHGYVRCFSAELEGEFQRERLASRIARYREGLWLGIFLYGTFLIADYFCLRPWFWLCVLVRVGINIPLALGLIFTISKFGRRTQEVLFAVSAYPATLGIIYLNDRQPSLLIATQSVVILMMLYAINALRPDFLYACWATPLLALFYSGYIVQLRAITADLKGTIIALTVSVLGISLLTCYRLEMEERLAYLLNRRNKEQNEALSVVNRELTRISLIDPLTNIPNRRAFNSTLRTEWDRALRNKQPLSLLMIDLDYFKQLNDTHGHEYGDTVLVTVARAMSDLLRAKHDILARFGGEEFIALLTDQSLESSKRIAQRLCETIRTLTIPLSQSGEETHVTISVGVASLTPTESNRPSALLRTADTALYEAKRLGRNRIHPPLLDA